MTIVATPAKLRSGDWGARIQGTAKPGDVITIVSRAGKRWTATIGKIVWTGDGVMLVTTHSQDRPRDGNGRRVGGPRGDGGPRGSRPCYMCGSHYCEGARGGLCEHD